MNWTREPPTVAGAYWWKETGWHTLMRLVIARNTGGFVVKERLKAKGLDGIVDVRDISGEWYGPLQPPE